MAASAPPSAVAFDASSSAVSSPRSGAVAAVRVVSAGILPDVWVPVQATNTGYPC